MNIGASTFYGIIKQSVVESVDELEKAGFDTIELMYDYDNVFTDKEIEALKKKKLNFSMHCPFIGLMLVHPNFAFSEPHIRFIEKSLDAAARIGCTHYVMHGGLVPTPYLKIDNPIKWEKFVDLFIERFKTMFAKYSKKGVKIVFENMGMKRQIGCEVADILKIQKEMPGVGFCLDIAHSELRKQTKEILDKINVDYVHVTDNDLEKDLHAIVGSGKIDFKGIFAVLKKKGFDGRIILENLSFDDCVESKKELEKVLK
jgi:sugar phosphate isomerase/epimerase